MGRYLLYIVNPIAGTREKKDLEQFIASKTTAAGIPFRIIHSVASGDYSFLLPEIEKDGITDVVVAGGDGTISQVAGSLMHTGLHFGIIPCGSGNGLAYTAGISKDPGKALEVIFNGIPVLIDGFTVNGRFACMLSGIGFDAKVAHEFAAQKTRGLKTYAALVSRNFFQASTYSFEIEANGLRFSTDAFFISIANSNQFGNHFTIAPEASLSDGLLDIVIAKKTAKPLLLFNLVRQILAGKIKKTASSLRQPVIYFRTDRIQISNKELAPLHIDGDPADTAEVFDIRVLKNSFHLLHPKK